MRIFALLLSLFLFTQCAGKPSFESLSLPMEVVARLIPSGVSDRNGWAADIGEAIEKTGRAVTEERACAVIAVIEQESGFRVDPEVKNLPEIVREGLRAKFKKLGPMAGVAVEAILHTKVPGTDETFKKKIARLRTESDLDRLFREIEASLRNRFPGPVVLGSLVAKLKGRGWLEDLNPVTTVGPMQVKVAYAKDLSDFKSLSDGEVRDRLYTRRDGVRAGVARLLDYEAKYTDVLYRFADYNSGVFSSRNAAFQSRLSDLLARPIVSDGDLLAYFPDGSARDEVTSSLRAMIAFGAVHGISERAVRAAADDEKKEDFEASAVWEKVNVAWREKTGREVVYARVPRLTLDSPKLSLRRSTEWFARSVKRRYDRCRHVEISP